MARNYWLRLALGLLLLLAAGVWYMTCTVHLIEMDPQLRVKGDDMLATSGAVILLSLATWVAPKGTL